MVALRLCIASVLLLSQVEAQRGPAGVGKEAGVSAEALQKMTNTLDALRADLSCIDSQLNSNEAALSIATKYMTEIINKDLTPKEQAKAVEASLKRSEEINKMMTVTLERETEKVGKASAFFENAQVSFAKAQTKVTEAQAKSSAVWAEQYIACCSDLPGFTEEAIALARQEVAAAGKMLAEAKKEQTAEYKALMDTGASMSAAQTAQDNTNKSLQALAGTMYIQTAYLTGLKVRPTLDGVIDMLKAMVMKQGDVVEGLKVKDKKLRERIATGTADYDKASVTVDKDNKCASDLEAAKDNLKLTTTIYSNIADMCTHAKGSKEDQKIQEDSRVVMWVHWNKKSESESALHKVQEDCAKPGTKFKRAPLSSKCNGDTGKTCDPLKLSQCQVFHDGATCSADHKCVCPPGFYSCEGACKSCGSPPAPSAGPPKEL